MQWANYFTNPTVVLFSAIIRIVESAAWRQAHPRAFTGTIGPKWDVLMNRQAGYGGFNAIQSADLANDFVSCLAVFVSADWQLGLYTSEQLLWLLTELSSEQGDLLLQVLHSKAVPHDLTTADHLRVAGYITSTEAARRYNMSATAIKDRAARGNIPGSIIKGKTWWHLAPVLDVLYQQKT